MNCFIEPTGRRVPLFNFSDIESGSRSGLEDGHRSEKRRRKNGVVAIRTFRCVYNVLLYRLLQYDQSRTQGQTIVLKISSDSRVFVPSQGSKVQVKSKVLYFKFSSPVNNRLVVG